MSGHLADFQARSYKAGTVLEADALAVYCCTHCACIGLADCCCGYALTNSFDQLLARFVADAVESGSCCTSAFMLNVIGAAVC